MTGLASRLPLSRAALDRDYLGREQPNAIERLWAHSAARVLPIFGDQALVDAVGRLVYVVPAELAAATVRVYLGCAHLPSTETAASISPEANTPLLAALVPDAAAADRLQRDSAEATWQSLRSIGAELSDLDAGAFTEAIGLLNWHRAHGFSPRTGRPTVADKAGWVRVDPEDGYEVFPRTDPAIIVSVLDEHDRLLLGNNALWERNRFSLVAGFVEPGESLEQAVCREVFEETGFRVAEPRYLGSQPWPFPASLMLGFSARLPEGADSVPRPDGAEILELRWFSREELADSLGDILLPGPTSIARAIIDEWRAGA